MSGNQVLHPSKVISKGSLETEMSGNPSPPTSPTVPKKSLLDAFKTSGVVYEVPKTERCDVNALQFLLQSEEISDDDRRKLDKYRKKCLKGLTSVVYTTYKGFGADSVGRYTAKNEVGLQILSKKVRSALAQKFYWDLDIENAHPVILSQIAKEKGWKCDMLDDYIQNRDQRLEDVGKTLKLPTRGERKQVFISILYGSCAYATQSEYLTKFTCEMKQLESNICKEVPALFEKIKKKKFILANTSTPESSCVSCFLQTIERTLLMIIQDYLVIKQRSLDVYIHDGGLVPKLPGETEFPEKLLRGCEEHIKTHSGFEVALAIKPLVSNIEIPDVDPDWEFPNISKEEYLSLKKEFEERHFYLEDSALVCREDDDKLTKWSSKDACESIGNQYRLSQFGLAEKISIFHPWLRDKERRTLKGIVFEPGEECKDYYNLFKGYSASKLPKQEVANNPGVARFVELLSIMLKQEKVHIDYVLNWVAHLIQKPKDTARVPPCIIFTGDQGVGKEMFWDFIGKRVLGQSLFYTTDNASRDIYGDFSTALEGRLLVKQEECSGALNRAESGKLKALISQTDATINRKGIQSYSIKKYARIVMTTNEAVPVKIEPGDRRFAIFHMGADKKGQSEWWDETYKLMTENTSAVFHFLNTRDINGFDVSKFPRTDYHKNLEASEVSPQEQFVKHLISAKEEEDYEPLGKMSATQFYKMYKNWCLDNGVPECSSTHFGRQLNPLEAKGLIVKGRDRNGVAYSIVGE
jgi:hypothetical protein